MQEECAYVVLLPCCSLGNESFVELPIFSSELLTFGKAVQIEYAESSA
jgi:hypothetical protein